MQRHLHSTMVSINRRPGAGSEPGEAYLHSTMVSINLEPPWKACTADGIYIPLWYLLISKLFPTTQTFNSYLHSTMVSINHHQ